MRSYVTVDSYSGTKSDGTLTGNEYMRGAISHAILFTCFTDNKTQSLYYVGIYLDILFVKAVY